MVLGPQRPRTHWPADHSVRKRWWFAPTKIVTGLAFGRSWLPADEGVNEQDILLMFFFSILATSLSLFLVIFFSSSGTHCPSLSSTSRSSYCIPSGHCRHILMAFERRGIFESLTTYGDFWFPDVLSLPITRVCAWHEALPDRPSRLWLKRPEQPTGQWRKIISWSSIWIVAN